jgi:hypothetical protein
MSRTVERLATDILVLQKHIDKEWHANRAPMYVAGAGDHLCHVDLVALRIVVEYVLRERRSDGYTRRGTARALLAAQRLSSALHRVERLQHALRAELRAA